MQTKTRSYTDIFGPTFLKEATEGLGNARAGLKDSAIAAAIDACLKCVTMMWLVVLYKNLHLYH